MQNKILLSILIPTKNRAEYTLKVIQHILDIKDERFQLVIQDNSDTNQLETQLSGFLTDIRLNYFYDNRILSFVDNFSLGISNCKGEYVTIIGDDDGINPVILDIAAWASEKDIEAITPSLPLIYFWPQSGVFPENDNGVLTITDFTSEMKFYDTKKEIKKLLSNGCQDYLSFNLAKAYHGLVKRSVLVQLKEKTGHFIGGLSPDIYLSMGISLLINRILVIDYPLTISGICKKSGSSDSATGKHTGEIKDAPHLVGHQDYKWSEEIPKFYSVETIWGDSALAPLKELNSNLVGNFNIDAISAYCLMLYPKYKNEILRNLALNHKISDNSFLIKLHLLYGYVSGPFYYKIRRKLKSLVHRKSILRYNDVEDIQSAVTLINEKNQSKNEFLFKLNKNFTNKNKFFFKNLIFL